VSIPSFIISQSHHKDGLVMFHERHKGHDDITDNDVLVTYHYSLLIVFRFRVSLLHARMLSLISH